jgi:hypothetical protein
MRSPFSRSNNAIFTLISITHNFVFEGALLGVDYYIGFASGANLILADAPGYTNALRIFDIGIPLEHLPESNLPHPLANPI